MSEELEAENDEVEETKIQRVENDDQKYGVWFLLALLGMPID